MSGSNSDKKNDNLRNTKHSVLVSLCRRYFSEISHVSVLYAGINPEVYVNAYETSENSYCEILFNRETPAGFISYRILEKPIDGIYVFIDDIYVIPEKRRNGIASEAVNGIFINCDIIGLYVFPENFNAIGFWNSFEVRTQKEKTSDGMFFLEIMKKNHGK